MAKTKLQRRGSSTPSRPASGLARSNGPGMTGMTQHLATGAGSVMNLPQESVLQLQRTAGNAAVSRLVAAGPAVVQRDDDLAGNPLVGLRRGDGLNFGTEGLRARVSILQGKLNEKMTAGLNPDGMFGPRTGRALQDFAESIGEERKEIVNKATGDALMDRNKKPPVPPDNDNQLDPALEFRLDEIQLEYLRQLKQANQALVDLERDVRDEEKPSESFEEKVQLFLLKQVLGTAIDAVFGGINSPGLLFKAITSGFLAESGAKDGSVTAEIISTGVNFPLEMMREKLLKTVEEMITPENKPRGSLELFIDAQRTGLFNATEHNFATVKERMRNLTPGPADPPQDLKSYRLDRAQDLHVGVMKGTAGAHHNQYRESLKQFVIYRAQGDLKQPEPVDGSVDTRRGTDMEKLRGDTTQTSKRGILEVRIPDVDVDNPQQKIEVEALHIAGLGARARKRLTTDPKFNGLKLSELGWPRRVWDGKAFLDETEIMLTRNELNRDPKLLFTTPDVNRWLERRGGTVFQGMLSVMNEVDQVTIDQVKSGKGLEGPD